MRIFGIMGWLFVATLAIYNIASSIVEESHPDAKIAKIFNYQRWLKDSTWFRRPTTACILFVIVSLLEVSQLWSYFLMQRQQYQMTRAEEVSLLDEQWAFGQVVAVVTFAPALVKALGVMTANRTLQDESIEDLT
jgi:hypothetical protein